MLSLSGTSWSIHADLTLVYLKMHEYILWRFPSFNILGISFIFVVFCLILHWMQYQTNKAVEEQLQQSTTTCQPSTTIVVGPKQILVPEPLIYLISSF